MNVFPRMCFQFGFSKKTGRSNAILQKKENEFVQAIIPVDGINRVIDSSIPQEIFSSVSKCFALTCKGEKTELR